MRLLFVLMMMGTSVLVASDAHGQPRAPLPAWTDPAGPPVEMDVWLRRLIGRYRIEGLVQVYSMGDCGTLPAAPGESPPLFNPACEAVTGVVDCAGIGSGPGVQCILNVEWKDLYQIDFEGGTVSSAPGSVSYLNPSMALFGLDPPHSALSYLLVDNKGLPEGGLGALSGSRVRFTTSCVNEAVGCERKVRIEAREEARLVFVWIDVEDELRNEPITSIQLTMRRVPQGEQATPSEPQSRRKKR